MKTLRPLATAAFAALLVGPASPLATRPAPLPVRLRRLLEHLDFVALDDGTGQGRPTLRLRGINLQIVNGLGATNGNPADPQTIDRSRTETNGVGNLIVGYLEERAGALRRGSHNVVIGSGHEFESFGGLVVGRDSALRGAFASVSGGRGIAAGVFSSVAGGVGEANGDYATIAGGLAGVAGGEGATVCGGDNNEAAGDQATVAGGEGNAANGLGAAISGGQGLIVDGEYEWSACTLACP